MKTKPNLEAILTDLANLLPNAAAVTRFQENYLGFIPEPPQGVRLTVGHRSRSGEEVPTDVPQDLQYVLVIQEMLRQLWKGDPNERSLRDLEQVLLSGRLGLSSDVPFLQPFKLSPVSGVIGVDWKRRTFVYRPQTPLQAALHLLMQESRKAKVCANPDCQAPYFIATRSNARYCSDDCLQAELRASKRSWWEAHGTEWRRNRDKQIKQARRKK